MLCLAGVVSAMVSHAEEPKKFNAINVSWGDHIVVFNDLGKLDTEEKIATAIRQWKEQFGVRHIYWRISSKIIQKYMIRAKGSATKLLVYSETDPEGVSVTGRGGARRIKKLAGIEHLAAGMEGWTKTGEGLYTVVVNGGSGEHVRIEF